MHSSDSIFTGIKVIDYRNGRYQGFFNSQTEKRHGMGILIDDDMNVYCSEWEDGKMSGLTFVYMSNGSYIYGLWRNNEPHGINLYRNKEFILIGAYHRGTNAGSTLAITDAINHMLVFNGEEIASKEKKKEVELISSENIVEISLFEDIIYHTAAKNQIKLNKTEVTLVNFLENYATRYPQHLQFQNKNGVYYFGFKTGLGFKFTLNGKVNHRTAMVSIGSHEDERVTDFGVKFHQMRCIQQGNFTLKETITYNRNAERPREKCLAIFQKNHKKALNFINEYYDYKSNLILNIEHFFSSRLYPKYQQDLKVQFQRRRLERQKSKQILLQNQQPMKFQKQDAKRLTPNKYDKNGSTPNIEKNQSSKDLMRNRSYSNLNKNSSKPTLSPIKNQRTKVNPPHQVHLSSQEYDQYKEIQEQLNHYWKKEVVCDRCKSKEKKITPNKVINVSKKKSLERKSINSKSTQKLHKQKSQKEIKYLLNYRPPQKMQGNVDALMNRQKNSHSKSFSNISKNPKRQNDKQKLRLENQMKIRQQLYDKERVRDARALQQINYPLTFTQFLGMKSGAPGPLFDSGAAPQTFSPSAQLRGLNFYGRSSRLEHDLSNELRGQGMGSHQFPLNVVNSIKNIQEISNRRDKILREFKALNTAVLPQDSKPQRHISSYHAYEPPLHTRQPLSSYHRPAPPMDEKERISQFNKRYRNYLMPGDTAIEKDNIQNEILMRQHYDQVSNEPYVASFTFSPARGQKLGETPASSKLLDNNLSRDYKERSKRRYQYFFDK